MQNNAIIDFMNRVDSGAKEFTLTTGKRTIYFFSRAVGSARYIYGKSYYGKSPIDGAEITGTINLYAIVANGTIYVLEEYEIGLTSTVIPPSGIRRFADYCDDFQKEYINKIKALWDAIPTMPVTDERAIQNCKLAARRAVFENRVNGMTACIRNDELDGDTAAAVLCGILTVSDVAAKYFADNKDEIQESVNECAYIDELAKTKDGIPPHLLAIGEFLNSSEVVSAKTVTIEFGRGEKTCEAKYERSKLLYALVNADYISEYSFPTNKTGEQVYEELSIDRTSHLTTSDIRKITYRNHVLEISN